MTTTDPTIPTDRRIIAAMQENPERGFRLLMSAYEAPVYWHIRRMVVSHDDAQDAAQETFIRVFRSFGSHREARSLAAWIYRIATNEALRLVERRERELPPGEDAGESLARLMADGYVDYSDLETVKLQRAILSLPTKQRITFNLRYYDEMDYADIAAVTSTSASSAKATYHAAKSKIIDYMNQND